MIKRMTLLSKKEGLAASDFRAYWAGCHADLAMCMAGISSYTQNRIDKTLWQQSDETDCFQADGVVELSFESDERMAAAQASAVGSRYIPDDEVNFLRGYSLCVVEQECEQAELTGVKVMVVATLIDSDNRNAFKAALTSAINSHTEPDSINFNWTTRTARRPRLWSEPVSPNVFAAIWFKDVAQAHAAFDNESEVIYVLQKFAGRSAAYLVNALVKK